MIRLRFIEPHKRGGGGSQERYGRGGDGCPRDRELPASFRNSRRGKRTRDTRALRREPTALLSRCVDGLNTRNGNIADVR